MIKPLLVTLLCCAFVACNKPASAEDKSSIESVLRRQQKAMESLNTKELRATSSGMERVWHEKATLANIQNEGYVLSIKDINILDFSESEATVTLTVYMKTTSATGSDQTYSSVRTLVNKDGNWKVSKIEDGEIETVLE